MTQKKESADQADFGEWPGFATMHLAWEFLLSGVRFSFLNRGMLCYFE